MFSFDFGQVDSLVLVVKCVVESDVLFVKLMVEIILVYFFIRKECQNPLYESYEQAFGLEGEVPVICWTGCIN